MLKKEKWLDLVAADFRNLLSDIVPILEKLEMCLLEHVWPASQHSFNWGATTIKQLKDGQSS